MKNAYFQKHKDEKHRIEGVATYDGIMIGLNIVTVALNRVYGFGNERITRLEQEVNRIIETEFIGRHDPEQAANDLRRAVEQIRRKQENAPDRAFK
jgi:hypothetical protein